jgi:hypothetical protein
MMQASVRLGFIVGFIALLAVPPARAQKIDFSDFAAERGLTLNGAAKVASAGDRRVLRLTPAEETQAGAAFFTEKVALKDGFETSFTERTLRVQERRKPRRFIGSGGRKPFACLKCPSQ